MSDASAIVMAPTPPEDDATRIERLQSELKTSGRVNYLLQEAGTKVVWNNEHLRAAIRKAVAALAAEHGIAPEKRLGDTAKALDAALDLGTTFADLALSIEKAS
jgi:hypothetical protein